MAEKPTYAELKERVQDLENRNTRLNRFQNISRTLFKISSAINTTSNLNELYKSIHGELSSVIDTTNFFIATYDKDQDSITFPYCVDSVDESYPPVIEISKVESLTAEIIRTGSPLLITKDEILNQRQKSPRKTPTCTPSEIWLGVPLKKDADIIGVMAVQSYNDANCYDQTDLEVMVSVADQVALAIEKKRSEKTLQESEERYRRLTENSPDMLFRISLPDGEYEYVSPAAEKIFSYPPETWYTNPLLIKKIIHPDFASYFSEQWGKLVNGIVPPVYEYKIVHKDKSERWVNQRNVLVVDDHDQPIALEGIVTDITERKQSEELLLQSEKKLRSTLDATPFPVAVADLNADKILYWSRSALSLFGHTVPTTSEWYQVAYPDPDYRQDVIERWKPFLEIAKTSELPVNTGEYQITCKDGSVKTCEIYATFITDFLIVTFSDITQRKRAEESLRAREEMMRSSQSVAHICSYSTNLNVNEIEKSSWVCSPEFYNIFGIDETYPHTIAGWVNFIDPDYREEVFDYHESVVKEKKSFSREYKIIRHNDGAERWVHGTGELEYDEKGTPVRMHGAIQDITERRRSETEKEKLQSQLVQAQKMEAVGHLAGGVAHDFNNMLGVILGHTEMALEEIDPAVSLYEGLKAVQHAAKHSADLTRQLLTFARKQAIAPKIIDLNEAVEGALNMLRRLIGEDITLLWQPGINLQPIKIDRSQVDQLLANLSVNARDAIDGVGKVTITTDVKTLNEDYCHDHVGALPGEYILLEVSDDGCGMDKKTLNHIFEPFFTTKEQGKGTGLGLASIYGIVKQNNGYINAYSEPDQGTTFKIYLPVYAAKSAEVSEKGHDLPAEHGSETILLVEDESAILKMTATMLTRLGYTVVVATTPGEAIRLAHEYRGRIDLLMTDVVMPEMNGRELAGNLLSHYPDLKRLFMSGYTANVIAHHGVLDQGVHFIQKPFSKKDLGGKVREALED